MPPSPKPDWNRLGALVRRRREALNLSQEAAAGAGGPSVATWRNVETGRRAPYSPRTLRSIARVLDWDPDAIEHIPYGADPVPVDADEHVIPPERDSDLADLRREIADLRAELAEERGARQAG